MHINQALKCDKTSMLDILLCREGVLQKEIDMINYHFFKRLRFIFIKLSDFSMLKKTELVYLTGKNQAADILRFEISSKKMNELLAQRQICAADIRCLDTKSKQCLKKLCLKNCLYSTTHSNSVPQLKNDLCVAESRV